MTVIVPSSAQHCHADIMAHSHKTTVLEEEDVPTDDESDSDDGSYDACDALFKQGDYLRMLRQLEREDEALREKERQKEQQEKDEDADGNHDSNTLAYSKYIRNQEGIYDDYKHVNYQYVDFGIVDPCEDADSGETDSPAAGSRSNQPLVIEQDRTVGKGGFVWDAGVILAESVLRMQGTETEWLQSDQPTKIIELGAGTGVTSLMIARARPEATVHLTDLPVLQPLLAKNCESCCPDGRATHGVLEWGKPLETANAGAHDVILGADVVAGIYDASGLAKTIYDLSHADTVVYLACRERLEGVIDRFQSHLRKLFTKIEKRDSDSSNRSPNVYILRVSGKRINDETSETECTVQILG